MNRLIKQKQRRNAFQYKVLCGRNGFPSGKQVQGFEKKRLTENQEDPIYSITFQGKPYVAKQVGKYGKDEWEIIYEMLSKNLVCSLMIDYYACVKSMCNHQKYIIMRQANMDLKDYVRFYEIQVNHQMVMDLVKFSLEVNQWCIKHLKLVYTDLKCHNILVLYPAKGMIAEKHNPPRREEVEYRLTDIGLMEDEDRHYKLDWNMLLKNIIVYGDYTPKNAFSMIYLSQSLLTIL